MAKAKTETVVGVPDLEKEFGLQGRTIRTVLRRAGLKAPETGIESFGPKARYEWTEGSKELTQVRSILREFAASKGNARRARTKWEEVEDEENSEDDGEDD